MSLLRRRMMIQSKNNERFDVSVPFDTPNRSITFVDGFFHAWNGDREVYHKNETNNWLSFPISEDDFIIYAVFNLNASSVSTVAISTKKAVRGLDIGISNKTPYDGTRMYTIENEYQYNGNTYYYVIATSIALGQTEKVYWFNLSDYTNKYYNNDTEGLLKDLLDYYFGVI